MVLNFLLSGIIYLAIAKIISTIRIIFRHTDCIVLILSVIEEFQNLKGKPEMQAYKTILTKIAENKSTITKYGVSKIGLFGSYLRNEQKPNSDIDILVDFEKGKITFDNYMDLKFFLEDLLKCNVDLVMQESIKPDLKPYTMGSVKYAASA